MNWPPFCVFRIVSSLCPKNLRLSRQVRVPDCFCSSRISMTSGSSNVTPATNSLVGWFIEPKFKAGCASLGYEEGNAGNTTTKPLHACRLFLLIQQRFTLVGPALIFPHTVPNWMNPAETLSRQELWFAGCCSPSWQRSFLFRLSHPTQGSWKARTRARGTTQELHQGAHFVSLSLFCVKLWVEYLSVCLCICACCIRSNQRFQSSSMWWFLHVV